MKAERGNISPVLLGSKTKSERHMGKTKTFKQFRDEHKRKTPKRRRRTDADNPTESPKVQTEKGTRIGGSTSYLLPSPRTGSVESTIGRYDTPPPPEPDF